MFVRPPIRDDGQFECTFRSSDRDLKLCRKEFKLLRRFVNVPAQREKRRRLEKLQRKERERENSPCARQAVAAASPSSAGAAPVSAKAGEQGAKPAAVAAADLVVALELIRQTLEEACLDGLRPGTIDNLRPLRKTVQRLGGAQGPEDELLLSLVDRLLDAETEEEHFEVVHDRDGVVHQLDSPIVYFGGEGMQRAVKEHYRRRRESARVAGCSKGVLRRIASQEGEARLAVRALCVRRGLRPCGVRGARQSGRAASRRSSRSVHRRKSSQPRPESASLGPPGPDAPVPVPDCADSGGAHPVDERAGFGLTLLNACPSELDSFVLSRDTGRAPTHIGPAAFRGRGVSFTVRPIAGSPADGRTQAAAVRRPWCSRAAEANALFSRERGAGR